MDRFQAMHVFVRVVEANSFTRAADTLGLPRTTVTTCVQQLERHLGVRLLNRTTRRISLTPDGAAYFKHATHILAQVEETESCFQESALRPRGRLRIDVPSAIGQLILIPSLCEFHDRYPDIDLVIGMGERQVDLVQEAVDCVIRIGELEDSSLVARRIGSFEFITCASPAYLERHGTPQTLEDLSAHQAVRFFNNTGRNDCWTFVVDGQEQQVDLPSKVAVNNWSAYLTCALQGFGLIHTARYTALPYLQSGALVEVLPAFQPKSMPISLLYPQNRQLSPKVRVFSDWVAELFARCPLLSGVPVGNEALSQCRVEAAQLLPAGEQVARRAASIPEMALYP